MNRMFLVRVTVLVLALSSGFRKAAAEQKVVAISPHNEAIRYEFAEGFRKWHEEKFGSPVEMEWRDLGGSSDALRFVQSEFAAKPDGIGIDCFFGGGVEPFLVLAGKMLLAPHHLPPDVLSGIPQNLHGIDIYDRDMRWYGAALSSFGILQSTLVQRMMKLPFILDWQDLAKVEVCDWVGMGDPRNSGTMNVMFESYLQAYGWEKGWRLLTQIAGNAPKIDRNSSTTAKEVSLGETAYAMAIDFYAFSQISVAGHSNMTFVLPHDFAAVSPDGIGILKGAPHELLAGRFLDFVLSDAGQKLWLLPRRHPEGPKRYSIERMSVRPELYRRFKGISNVEFSPFDLTQNFTYDPSLARSRREIVAALAGALFVDTHQEVREAWHAIRARPITPEILSAFGKVPINDAEAKRLAAAEWKKPEIRNLRRIEWQTWAQKKYRGFLN